MDSLELTFRLLDRVSPTLDVMDRHLAATTRSLGAVDKALRDLDRAEKQARFANERDPMKRYRLGLELMRDQMTGAKSDVAGAGSSLAMFGGAAGVAAGVAFAAANAIGSMARAAVEGAVSITRFGIESASFKRDTLTAFELIEGSGKQAETTFDRLSALADKTPFKTSDVLTFGKVLRSTGFTIRETEDLLAGMFDVGAVQGKEGPEKVRSLLEGITSIKGRDALNLHTLQTVITSGAAAGLNMQSITAAIARGRKTTIGQAGALIHTGQIKGTEGINAILDAIQTTTDKGKALGSATLQFGQKSLEGQLSTFSSRLESIFYGVDIQPLVDLMASVNELLSKDSPTGKRIREFATETLGSMFRTAAQWLTPENIEIALDKVVNAAEKTRDAIKLASIAVESFAKGFGEGFTALPDKLDPATDALVSFNDALGGEDKAKVWREFGRSLGLMVDMAIALGKAFLWINAGLGVFKDLVAGVLPPGVATGFKLASMVSSGAVRSRERQMESFQYDVGKAAGDGLIVGIDDAGGGVNAAMKALADDAVKTTARTLEIHSPSRVMMRLGVYTAQGFEQGLERGDANRAMAELVAAPSVSASSGGARGGWGTPNRITLGDIYVTGADRETAREIGREVRRSVQTELLALLEDMERAA